MISSVKRNRQAQKFEEHAFQLSTFIAEGFLSHCSPMVTIYGERAIWGKVLVKWTTPVDGAAVKPHAVVHIGVALDTAAHVADTEQFL